MVGDTRQYIAHFISMTSSNKEGDPHCHITNVSSEMNGPQRTAVSRKDLRQKRKPKNRVMNLFTAWEDPT